jgi:hypothetical protein
MKRMRRLSTAAVLPLLFPLGAGAVPDAERELPKVSSVPDSGLRGTDLAIQVAPGLALGLRGDPRERESDNPTPSGGTGHFRIPETGGGGVPAPIPEPSSLPLFAAGLLWARAAARRARRQERLSTRGDMECGDCELSMR